MSTFANSSLLVTGASGHLGRGVVEELLARGAGHVIAGTRSPEKIADLAAKGAMVRAVDFDDPAGLAAAFSGVERLLIVSTDGIGKRVVQQQAAIAAAKAAGVKHILYTSAPAARPNGDAGLGIEHFWTEQALAASGLDFTILRNHMYAENNLADAAHVVSSGQLFGLVGDRGTAYVTRADAARAAAGALLVAEGKSIEDVTGPAIVANAERAELYGTLAGKPVALAEITPEQMVADMVGAGLPQVYAEALVAFQKDAVRGYHAIVTDAVERFSGRKPQAFADFLAAHKSVLLG